jgi:hypothetical protein
MQAPSPGPCEANIRFQPFFVMHARRKERAPTDYGYLAKNLLSY